MRQYRSASLPPCAAAVCGRDRSVGGRQPLFDRTRSTASRSARVRIGPNARTRSGLTMICRRSRGLRACGRPRCRRRAASPGRWRASICRPRQIEHGFMLLEAPAGRALDVHLRGEDVADVGGREIGRGAAAGEEAPVPLHAADRFAQVSPAVKVDDHVDAAAAQQRDGVARICFSKSVVA